MEIFDRVQIKQWVAVPRQRHKVGRKMPSVERTVPAPSSFLLENYLGNGFWHFPKGLGRPPIRRKIEGKWCWTDFMGRPYYGQITQLCKTHVTAVCDGGYLVADIRDRFRPAPL